MFSVRRRGTTARSETSPSRSAPIRRGQLQRAEDSLSAVRAALEGNAQRENVAASLLRQADKDHALEEAQRLQCRTPQLTMLAKQGIILDRHYVHWHCSPTRRSLLTGRTPLHHGEMLSGVATDDIDLRWKTIGQKLEGVGYKSHVRRLWTRTVVAGTRSWQDPC